MEECETREQAGVVISLSHCFSGSSHSCTIQDLIVAVWGKVGERVGIWKVEDLEDEILWEAECMTRRQRPSGRGRKS